MTELDYDFMQEAESGLTAEELASLTQTLTKLEGVI